MHTPSSHINNGAKKTSSIVNRIIGKNIRLMRSMRNLSQEDLASRLCLPENTMADYEAGTATIPAETLFHIAEHLRCDLYGFFKGLNFYYDMKSSWVPTSGKHN